MTGRAERRDLVSSFSRPCGNPPCSARLTWHGGRGRPPVYCSTLCRKQAANARAKLSAQILELEAARTAPATTRRARTTLEGEIAALRWMYEAYHSPAVVTHD